MSDCIVYMNINGEKLGVSLKDSDPSVIIDSSIVEALKQNPEALNTLVENLRLVGNKTDITPIEIKDLKRDGVLANCTVEQLRNLPEYSHIRFPDVNANILLVDSLKIGGVPMYGRTIDSNGEEIIIAKNTTSDIIKLANYLSIKDAIQNGAVLDKSSKYYPKLEELYNKKKNKKHINKVEDIILAYMQDKSDFKSTTFSDGSSVIQFMEKLTRTLQDYSLPKEYNSPIVTELNYRKKWLGNKGALLEYSDLYETVRQYIPNLINELGVKNLSSFVSVLQESDGKIAKFDDNIQEENNLKALYQLITQGEPEFNYKFVGSNSKGIIIKSDFKSISDKYAISYNTIAMMPSEEYRGYTIYEYNQGENPLYFISRGSLLETSTFKPTNSKLEAQTKIDELITNQSIRQNSFIEFMFRDAYQNENGNKQFSTSYSEDVKSNSRATVGQIINVLDIAIDPNTFLNKNEAFLLNGNYTINDFYNVVDSYNISSKQKQNIKSLINTPQKIAAYIYKVNERLGTDARSSGANLYKIAEQIEKSPLSYYYIEDVKKSDKLYKYKLIKTTLDEIKPYKQNKAFPSQQWFSAISTVLSNEFGVQSNLVTSEEVKENFKNIADPNIDKAFVYNGEVYINTSIAKSSDLLHEYTHLILGIIKSNPELVHNYEELVRGIYYSKDGQLEANKIRDAYSKLPEMDVMEEVFCNLFSGYIRKSINRDTKSIFEGAEEELKSYTSNIFNTPITSFEDFYNKSVESVFGKFKKKMSSLLQNENLDFGSTKQTRQITNWISKQIEEGNIIEKC